MRNSPFDFEKSRERLAEVEKLVKEFEDCTLQPAAFHHRDHLMVALWYQANSYSSPSDLFRIGLLRLVDFHKLNVYNETITLFWIKLVYGYWRRNEGERGLADMLGDIISAYPDKNFIYEYYSKDLLMSDEAKSKWVDPDLKVLDF